MAYNTKYKAPIVPSINFKYSWGDNHNLRFSYARGFRAPSLKELYLFFIDSNHEIEGNPDLKAENSNSFNFSLNGTIIVY
jgi:outer membrane receptor for ferrienterochelin and colicins